MKMVQRLAIALVMLATSLVSDTLGQGHNVLVLLADDIGIDRIGAYGWRNAQGQAIAPRTTNIDRLASEGVLFRNAWASPACSTSRAQILTGKYPNRTGVGAAVGSSGSGTTGLRADFKTIPDLLPASYLSGILGKWHLAAPGPLGALTQGIDHAPRCGFDFHVGTFANFLPPEDYFDWSLLQSFAVDLHATTETPVVGQYATSRTTSDAIRIINRLDSLPWFVLVSYHSAHTPHHVPPVELIQDPTLDLATTMGKGKAMIEALDTEIGRLLSGIAPETLERTTIVFLGDNGTNKELVEPPFNPSRAKGSVYNGGVHVPLIVKSPITPMQVRGGECAALVDVTDILPTVVELAGDQPPVGIDGHSLVPLLIDANAPSARKWIYAERFKPNFVPTAGQSLGDQSLTLHHQTARSATHKLIRRWPTLGGGELFEFYDLENDFFEATDLLEQGALPPALQIEFDSLLRVIQLMAQ